MKTLQLSICAALALCLTIVSTSFAQTSAGSMLYTPNIDLSSGPQNEFTGTAGGIFHTTYSFYHRSTGWDITTSSHVVTLWDNSTLNIIASATVPAETAAPLVNG